ncbi:MAG: integral rane sensor signal transduction histidine kinase [Burkholderiaceae bacterium]|nr:integral rane sensor signal transduction histidine kinase [Burkholderiaceae bacterium]
MIQRLRRFAALCVLFLHALLLPAVAHAESAFSPSYRHGALLVCGALFMMFLYHLVIFISRGSHWASLFLAIYCLLRTVNSLFSEGSGWGILFFMPSLDMELAGMIGLLGLTLSFSFLQAFFRQVLPRQFPLVGLYGLIAAGMVCLLFELVYGITGLAVSLLFGYTLLVSVYSIVNLARASFARESGAAVLLLGYLAMVASGINDLLLAKGVIDSIWLTPLGTLTFILCQSGLLAYRFSRSFAAAEQLSAQLERQNSALRQEIAERNRLEQKLNTVSEEERRFMSRALHDGLCQELTAARLRCSLLQSAAPEMRASTELRKLSELLEGAVDQAYELSRGVWPVGMEIADLPRALKELGDKLTAEHGIAVTVEHEMHGFAPSQAQREHVFLIAKEALSNIVKHARARHARISLRHFPDGMGARLQLLVEDDGIGLRAAAPSKGGLGSKIMAHHADFIGGTLSLLSRPEGGTCVRFVLARAG